MTEHLPEVYTTFRTAHPSVAVALDELGSAVDEAGPLDPKTMRLVKLSIAVGAGAEGAVRSNVRKALYAGATPDEIHHVSLAAVTTIGFPAAIAAIGWIDQVLEA